MVGRDTFKPFLDTFLLVTAVGATGGVCGIVIGAFALTVGTSGADTFVLGAVAGADETLATARGMTGSLIDLFVSFFLGDFS